jgi:hypothetical protein
MANAVAAYAEAGSLERPLGLALDVEGPLAAEQLFVAVAAHGAKG